MTKNIMDGGYTDFIDKYFPSKHPQLRAKFPPQIEWSFISKDFTGVKRPFDMSVEDFDDFRLIEHEWFLDNGYLPKYDFNPSFVNIVGGLTTIPLRDVKIESIIPIDDRTTIINVKSLHDNKVHSYSVVGNIDYVNNKLRIS